MKKIFQVFKHKITVYESENGFTFKIDCPYDKEYVGVAKDISELKSELHELANNNDAGRAIAEKVHNWYYSTHN